MREPETFAEQAPLYETWGSTAENVGQDVDAVDEAGDGAAEIGGAVDRPGSGLEGDEGGFGDGALEVEAAGHEDHDLGLVVLDLLPGALGGGLALVAEGLLAAGDLDHLGDPVSGAHGRVQPR